MDPQEPQITAQPTIRSNWLTREHALALLLIVVTVGFFFLCFLILRPFLSTFAWALAFAVVAHPLHAAIERRIGNANVAAALAVFAVILILIVPASLVINQLVQEASNNIQLVDTPPSEVDWREQIKDTSFGDAILWVDQRIDLNAEFNRFVEGMTSQVGDVVRGSIWTIASVLIMIFTLFYLFRDRRWIIQVARSMVPLSPGETDEVFNRIGETIHATVFGSLSMAVLQGVLGGLIFWYLGLPSPVVWGMVMGVLATIPNLGAFVIWVPAALILAVQGEWGKAGILAAWGAIAIGMIDNLLYPVVVGSKLRMHSLPVFFAILGGVMVFGPAGLILGPVIFAITEALIDVWRRRTAHGRAAEAGVGPPTKELPKPVRDDPPMSKDSAIVDRAAAAS